mgnify:CR=1 FL=1
MSGVLRRTPAGLVALSRHTQTRAKGRNPCPGKASSVALPFLAPSLLAACAPESKLAISPPKPFLSLCCKNGFTTASERGWEHASDTEIQEVSPTCLLAQKR